MDLLEHRKDLLASRRECFGNTYIQHTPWIPDGVDEVIAIFANRFKNIQTFRWKLNALQLMVI